MPNGTIRGSEKVLLRLTRADRTCLSSKDMQPGNTYKIYVNLQNLKDVAPMNASNASNASNATVRVVNVTGNETVEGDVDVTIDVYLDGKLMNSASGPKSNLLKGIDVLKTVSPDAEVTIKDETGQVVHEEDMKPGQKYEIYVRT
ncbi:unnamed protein product [Durusdinium trenchii]|uniref:Uncharacterized protein n=1 Tax=Durusdinium trenchii TaxID=1381693 RepID=A0ABP0H9J1_9DINO